MKRLLTNPHSVLAALDVRPGDVSEVRLPPCGAGPAWKRVGRVAAELGVPVIERPAERSARGARPGSKRGREGGAGAEVEDKPPVRLEELLSGAAGHDDGRGLWLALDRIEDPRNLGAAFRAAAFFGVAGMLITRDGSAPITSVTYDAASGGVEWVPHALAGNLSRDLKTVSQAGVWILGAAEQAGTDVHQVDRTRPWMLVLGNEEHGLRRLTREACDELCRVSPWGAPGKPGSLNVATAAAVLLSALRRPE